MTLGTLPDFAPPMIRDNGDLEPEPINPVATRDPPALTGAVGEETRARRSAPNWLWIVIGVGLAVGKGAEFRALLHHPWGWTVLLGAGAVGALLRGRLVTTAVFAAPAIALLVDPAAWLFGLGIGFGAFALLITLFVAIGAVLRFADLRAAS
jgi:hypothetical protein